jgi:hypothetical protein
MSYIKQMFDSHPVTPSSDRKIALECITACYACAEACNACADACLGEPMGVGELVSCIRHNQDCADVCVATARVVSRLTRTDKVLVGALLRACSQACRLCAAECDQHADMMTHCKVCAGACERCETACEALLTE